MVRQSRMFHFLLIVIATLILLWKCFISYTPTMVKPPSGAIVWAEYSCELVKVLACYLGFCLIVLGHAVCSGNIQADGEPKSEVNQVDGG
jgi:hypothetical protein